MPVKHLSVSKPASDAILLILVCYPLLELLGGFKFTTKDKRVETAFVNKGSTALKYALISFLLLSFDKIISCAITMDV